MTYNKDIQTINVSDVMQKVGAAYSDGDIALIQNVKDFETKATYLLDMVFVAFCERGKVMLHINGKEHTIGTDSLVVMPPKTIVDNIMISPDVEFKAIGISYEAAQRDCRIGKNAWDVLHYVSENPVLKVSRDSIRLLHAYAGLLALKLSDSHEGYYKEVMGSLFNAIYYEILSGILPLAQGEDASKDTGQGGQICKRFFELLAKGEGRERSVTSLAAKLCLTPKYLSAAVKAASGKTALSWIHLYAVKMIERQLKYSDRSVKEIAADMNFPNVSFFGKFVKTHLGVSPTEYRRRIGRGKQAEQAG